MNNPAVGHLRWTAAVKRLARVCYQAQFADAFDDLDPKSIHYALAMQVGEAALREMEMMTNELKSTGAVAP